MTHMTYLQIHFHCNKCAKPLTFTNHFSKRLSVQIDLGYRAMVQEQTPEEDERTLQRHLATGAIVGKHVLLID